MLNVSDFETFGGITCIVASDYRISARHTAPYLPLHREASQPKAYKCHTTIVIKKAKRRAKKRNKIKKRGERETALPAHAADIAAFSALEVFPFPAWRKLDNRGAKRKERKRRLFRGGSKTQNEKNKEVRGAAYHTRPVAACQASRKPPAIASGRYVSVVPLSTIVPPPKPKYFRTLLSAIFCPPSATPTT